MTKKNVKENIETITLKSVLHFLDDDPDIALPKIMKWIDKYDVNNMVKPHRDAIRPIMQDKNNNWYKLLKSLFTDVDSEVRKTAFENFIINATIIGGQRQDTAKEKYHCNIPWAILMDPTSACNLHCTGCWAAEYGNKLNMDYTTLDSIIKQGKEVGTFFYIYSGGEPMVRKDDIIKLCYAHPDCEFLAFTNGTLIDDKFADEMLKVKNFIPAFSIEGFEEATDSRRGNGTYQAVIKAMDILKRKKLPFGVSCCYTKVNTASIGSEAFIDDVIRRGAKFAWFFTYIPVGVGAPTDLIATAEQRAFMYQQIRAFRSTKSIFMMDFWNDGEYVKGCIAGGRSYLHINANGDIEPCAFIHYSDSNIHEKTLIEAYQSPLFMQYKAHQPFNQNHLRPCPLLDNNGALADMVHNSKAVSTDMIQHEDVNDLCAKCKEASVKWKPIADKLWDKSHPNN